MGELKQQADIGSGTPRDIEIHSGNPPPIYDPFCGGGSIPLEAQRLGLEAHASDLNPVAVLITKALIEIPPKFAAGRLSIRCAQGRMTGTGMWEGAHGLAEDVRYYGQWMRDRAFERIGHIYPKVKLAKEHGWWRGNSNCVAVGADGQCPNPACGAQMPLVRLICAFHQAREKAWVEPTSITATKTIRFEVKTGEGNPPDRNGQSVAAQSMLGLSASCLLIYISRTKAGGTNASAIMAIVAEGRKGRVLSTRPMNMQTSQRAPTPTKGS